MVVTAAGVAYSAATHQTSLEDWRLVTDINLTGTFITCKAVAPHMLAQGSVSRHDIAAVWVAFFSRWQRYRCGQGSIITIASVQGLEASQELSGAYGASKAGVILFTKNMAADYGHAGIRCNA